MSTTFAVLGIHGFGRTHLATLAALARDGLAEVVAVADPRGSEGVENLGSGVPCFADLSSLLAHTVPDVVVLATPIHTHAPLAIMAMRAGAHVLLEKPTASSLAEFEELVAASEQTGRAVQVGFQSFGSHTLPELDRLIAAGTIGTVTGIAGLGTWTRDLAYYRRSAWAGHRTLDGVAVVDGVVTNPLAHAVATALRADRSQRMADIAEVEVDLYHAHDIEADDTSSVRVRTTRGTTLTFGLTLCAPEHSEPVVIVQGTSGEIHLGYTLDQLTVRTADGEQTERFGRTNLLQNLTDHIRDPAVPLLAPVADTGAFMRVLETVRTAPSPRAVDPGYVAWEGEGEGLHPVIDDIRAWCARAGAEHKLFRELQVPWAQRS